MRGWEARLPRTILLLDDSRTIRELIKVHLVGNNFEFVEAGDGARALQLVRLVPVDLVIADITMPGMDGLSFLKQLRADGNAAIRRIPVILLTGNKAEAEPLRAAGMAAGANDFVLKPVSSAQLTDAIRRILQVPEGRS